MDYRSFRWNKPCEVEDFAHPRLAATMSRVFPATQAGPYRKEWEVAMAVLAAETHLQPDQRQFALGVGAGTEATTFYLTNLFRWVFATDIYADSSWSGDSPLDMLHAPERHSRGIPFRKSRLIVQHRDGRNLEHEDRTFDFIYSCGSIEHFGEPADIQRAAREMGRVLRPGGILTVSTEYCVRGAPGYLESDTLLLSADDLMKLIVHPSGCVPIDDPVFGVSEDTLAAPVAYAIAIQDRIAMMHGKRSVWSQYPHVVIDNGETAWTSYHLTLRKPEA